MKVKFRIKSVLDRNRIGLKKISLNIKFALLLIQF